MSDCKHEWQGAGMGIAECKHCGACRNSETVFEMQVDFNPLPTLDKRSWVPAALFVLAVDAAAAGVLYAIWSIIR